MSERDDEIARDLAKRCRAGDTTADLIDAISAALTTARAEGEQVAWAKALELVKVTHVYGLGNIRSEQEATVVTRTTILDALEAAAKEGRE